MVTGQLPPPAIQGSDAEAPPSISKLAPDVSPELKSVISRMMAKNPEHRFQSFNQVVAAMCNWASGEQIKELVVKNVTPKQSGQTAQQATSQSAQANTAQTQQTQDCLLYTSPSPRDATLSRMPSSA